MATFALIHGAWGSGWHWAAVPDELRRAGHDVVAPDLPCDDPAATFDDYADVVLAALGELVYVAAMIPEPGLSLNDQFARGDRMLLRDYEAGIEGPDEAGLSRWVDFDVYHRVSCHDCSEPVARERFERSRPQSTRPYRAAWRTRAHPAVPTRYVLCTGDRLVEPGFARRAARDRLGTEPVELPGSHAPMAACPAALAKLLCAPS